MGIDTAIALAVTAGIGAWWLWPRSAWSVYRREAAKLSENMRGRGLSGPQQVEEIHFRHSMAAIRQRASDAVLHAPEDYDSIISDAVKSEIARLGMTHQPLAKRLLAVCKDAHLDEILYPDALRAVHRVWRRRTRERRRPHVDHRHIAAVRTVR